MHNTYSKKIIIIAAVGVIVIVIEIVVLWWLSGKIVLRSKEITTKQRLLTEVEKSRLEFSSLRNDWELVKDFVTRLDTALPEQEQLYSLIGEINNVATRSGNRQTLTVEGFFPRPSPVEGVSFMPFSASIAGSYQSLRNYLQDLATLPFFVRIESILISSPENITAESRINISGKIFLRTPK